MIKISSVHIAGTTFADPVVIRSLAKNIADDEETTNDMMVKPEPENPHDPNALKILYNEEKVGYINANDARAIVNLMQKRNYTNLFISDCKSFTKEDNVGFWVDIVVSA